MRNEWLKTGEKIHLNSPHPPQRFGVFGYLFPFCACSQFSSFQPVSPIPCCLIN